MFDCVCVIDFYFFYYMAIVYYSLDSVSIAL